MHIYVSIIVLYNIHILCLMNIWQLQQCSVLAESMKWWKWYLVYPFDLALNGVVHSACACGALMTRHVNTHQMHVGWEELQVIMHKLRQLICYYKWWTCECVLLISTQKNKRQQKILHLSHCLEMRSIKWLWLNKCRQTYLKSAITHSYGFYLFGWLTGIWFSHKGVMSTHLCG